MFEEAPLENQIDRDRIFADAGLKREFRAWLLDPKHLAELDRGTILVPEKFLATGAIAATPVGFAPSNLQPAFGFVQADGYGNEVFGEGEVVAALKKAAARGVAFENIRSVAGFERRLNDMTCSGCHQTRGIGGFHFPGVDWMAEKPSNSTWCRRRRISSATRFAAAISSPRCATARRRIIPADFPAARNCAAARNSPAPNMTTAGARIAISNAQGRRQRRQLPLLDLRRGARLSAVGNASRMGMCFVKSR